MGHSPAQNRYPKRKNPERYGAFFLVSR
jgi:hypothetical protein